MESRHEEVFISAPLTFANPSLVKVAAEALIRGNLVVGSFEDVALETTI